VVVVVARVGEQRGAAEAVAVAAEAAAVAEAEAEDSHEEIPIINPRICKGEEYDLTGNK